ncbi:MAG: hypothetical protein ABIR63_03255 [Sphingomicrobium sp.]
MAIKNPRKIGDDTDLIVAESDSSSDRSGDTRTIRAGSVGDKLRDGGEKLAGQAADKARGLVSQGLERTADALSSVSKMVEDTANGIDERVGAEYGDYARKAAGALDKAGKALASKSPDELIDDTRKFVKNSPGIALAGAAVVGFVLARLVKSGLAANEDDRG